MVQSAENPILEMLKTIRMPMNLHYLTSKLPEANYDPIKTKFPDKDDFLHKNTMPNLGGRLKKETKSRKNNNSKNAFRGGVPKENIAHAKGAASKPVMGKRSKNLPSLGH